MIMNSVESQGPELRFKDLRIHAGEVNTGCFYSIFFMGAYDRVISRLGPEDVVVDGGANIGLFSMLAGKRAKQVFAFEPNPRNFALLTNNLVRNRCENVVPIRAALSDRVGESYLLGEGESSHLASHGTRVQTLTIDSVTHGAATCVKLDVEGATMLAMRGLTSRERVHTICFEVEQDQLDILREDFGGDGPDPGSCSDLISALSRQGYKMESYNGIGVSPAKLVSADFIRAELVTHFFAGKAFLKLLAGAGKNLFYPPSLTDSRIDTLYFYKIS
jgi:FkbM family methyltransferase